jgi:hypothetical protein
MNQLQPLPDLIAQAQQAIEAIKQHPDYKALEEKGYQPDLNIYDASTALTYLDWEVSNDET